MCSIALKWIAEKVHFSETITMYFSLLYAQFSSNISRFMSIIICVTKFSYTKKISFLVQTYLLKNRKQFTFCTTQSVS